MSDSKPGRAQVLLDGEGLVADGVAVGEGGQELVDAPRRGLHSAGGRRPSRTISSSVLFAPGLEFRARLHLQGAVLEVLHLEVQPRHLEGEVVQEVRVGGVELRLAREGGDHRGRVPEQLLHRAQPPPHRLQRAARAAAAAAVDRLRVEGEVPPAGGLEDLAQQARLQVVGLEHGVQRVLGDLADLGLGEQAARASSPRCARGARASPPPRPPRRPRSRKVTAPAAWARRRRCTR